MFRHYKWKPLDGPNGVLAQFKGDEGDGSGGKVKAGSVYVSRIFCDSRYNIIFGLCDGLCNAGSSIIKVNTDN